MILQKDLRIQPSLLPGPSELDNFTDELRGVIPRSFEYLFFLINREVERVLSMGWRNRRVASTSMNRESSRSHAVFTMTLESKESINEVVNIRMSQLNLVDLAGSERQKDTHTEGSRLKEASSINRSLMCLGQVIMALDSLGGNAKTYIIANVHPGSKCFGETLSTLQFAQRAKLIKNKAIINEDTQGNVRQLQAEVKKLKEQLAQALASPTADYGRETLLEKVAQLEEAWTQKDKFIHSSRMIVRFREDHIARLEKKLKAGQNFLSDNESQALIDQLKEEIKILRDQVEHHPKMTRYAAENFSLRQENRQLRSLESVVKAEELVGQVAAELEEAFQTAMESERLRETSSSTTTATDSVSAATIEKLKAQLLQKQSDLASVLRAFEEYKEVTKKQMSQLESEKIYLDKSNKHLENILEATNAYKKQEVSELNRIHVETIKILTTPTKAYNLRSRLVPLSSPDHLNGTDGNAEDIWGEQPPSDMTEMALTEELRQVQEQASRVQTQLNEEEMKNTKLLQQIAKLEAQITVISQECEHKDEQLSTEKANRDRDQLNLQDTISELQQSLQSEQKAADVLRSEIHDLRLVLQSSDKELAAVKNELRDGQSEQQREMSQLSSSLISTQLQLDKASKLVDLEQNLTLTSETIKSLEQKIEQDKDVVLDLINQTRDLRTNLSEKDQTITHLSEDVKDITVQHQQEAVEKTIKNGGCKPLVELTVTPKSLPRTPRTPGSFSRDLTQVLENQERELENRRSSMMTMEILLAELNAERTAKNEEIQRLKTQLTEKEMVRMEIQALLDKFYTKQNELAQNGNNRLQEQEAMLAQSQTCVQELTTELRNRCLDLRELSHRLQDEDKLLQENEVLRKQNDKLSEENGKLVGHKNHKQRIEYLVKLKRDNTKLQEENEKLRTEMSLMRDSNGYPALEMT
ncbi:hypothetical protein INR49_030784 [Caranx melampygus]|nr:hypothetical protein INR49_030784 [Caranx melampygus]